MDSPSLDETTELPTNHSEAEASTVGVSQNLSDMQTTGDREAQLEITPKSLDDTYRVLIESMSQAAMTVARDGTILYCNSQFGRMVGRTLDQIIGAQLSLFFKQDDEQQIAELIRPSGRGHKAQEAELELPGKVPTVVMVSATRLPYTETKACKAVIITDITDRKRAERAKDEFISLASHQLRTPATGVKQYLGMLLEGYAGELTDDQQTFIRTAYNSNEKQLAIINSILRTAQIDSGVYKMEKTPQNLSALVDMVLIDFYPVLQMRGQKVVAQLADSIEVAADPAELSVAIANLVENASKYSPTGTTIWIKATQTAHTTKLTIRDQGVGILPGDYGKIFEKFTRVDNEMSDTVNGSGLGLYWVRRIIEMHGGKISLSSVLGKGTTFTVSLPR